MKKFILFISINGLLFAACKKNYQTADAPTASGPKRVVVQPLIPSQEPIAILSSGVISSETEMNLSFKTGGIVLSVLVNEGQKVNKGQLLAQLDMAEIDAQLTQARNSFEKAKRDLERTQNLYRDTVATLEQRQDAATAFEIARANLDIAEFNHRYSKIKAPVKGKVLKKMTDPSELVSAGQPIFLLGTSGKKGAQVINIGLPDKDVVKVQPGDSAQITFDAFPQRTYRAEVTEIAEAANPATGTFEVELTLADQYYPELKNGFVGKVKLFPSDNTDGYIRIPMTALVEAEGKEVRLFLTEDKQTVYSKRLAVEHIQNDFFTIAEKAVQNPSWVILQGAQYLNENDSIFILN